MVRVGTRSSLVLIRLFEHSSFDTTIYQTALQNGQNPTYSSLPIDDEDDDDDYYVLLGCGVCVVRPKILGYGSKRAILSKRRQFNVSCCMS